MELNDQEYKEFQAMKKQSGIVDKILLVVVALVILFVICTVIGSFAAA